VHTAPSTSTYEVKEGHLFAGTYIAPSCDTKLNTQIWKTFLTLPKPVMTNFVVFMQWIVL
jgi:hypothetical protein